MTNQTIHGILPGMLETYAQRLLAAYPAIYLACHRDHTWADEAGNSLTEKQASVLNRLDATRPTPLSKLAEHMGVGCSTTSTTVARLVRAGYIVRKPGTQDRRTAGLSLTPLGKRIQAENTVLNPQLVRRMFKLMAPAEAERAPAGMESMAQAAAILLKWRKRERD